MIRPARILFASLSAVIGCGGDSATPATATTSKPSVWDQYEKNPSRGADGKKGHNASQVTVNGRQVKAIADVSVKIDFQGEIAFVKLEGRTVAIDFGKRTIAVDDKEHAKLPGDAKVVEVRFLKGALTFTVDGAAVPAAVK